MTAWEIVQRPERDQLGEAPFWDTESQSLFWVDIPNKQAKRLVPATGAITRWSFEQFCSAAFPTTRGDAMVALRDGLYRLDMETGETTAFARPDTDPGNRANEVRTDPQGRIWFGTMADNLGPDGKGVPLTRSSGAMFCVDAHGHAQRMLSEIGITNVLCWSPDGRRFYTADTRAGVVWSFDYDPDGPAISNRKVFLDKGLPGNPDGGAMDEDGCLWNARWGGGQVIRFTPDGRIDRTIELPVRQPSSCCFGGRDRHTLYVTSAYQEMRDLGPDSLDGSLFAVQLDVAGLPMRRFEG
ncbi:MAG: SMP-30/gluconolactonase/LRE family protein [Caulobacteraceae bacterium]